MSGHYFGWDIGGAHLKVARLDHRGAVTAVRQIACPLWRGIQELERACALLDFPIDADDAVHAVTMTGELCDIFTDRADGVRRILEQFLRQVGAASRVRIYGGYRGWLTPEEACGGAVDAVASANWLALAAYTAELVGDGVLLDIGSTTTDIVPLVGHDVRCVGRDDASRLSAGELVYTGVVRTPVFDVCTSTLPRSLATARGGGVRDHGRRLPPARAHRRAARPDAARRRAQQDQPGSARRLARMLGLDLARTSVEEMRLLTNFIAACQRRRIEDSLALVASRVPELGVGGVLVGAGAGRFLVQDMARLMARDYVAFETLVDGATAEAEAIAVARPRSPPASCCG